MFCNQSDALALHAPVLAQAHDLIDSKANLSLPQAYALFVTALDFQPDVIIELGRGAGNSTAVFAQAASVLGDAVVHSFCLSNHWQLESKPKLESLFAPDWFDRIVVHTGDLLQMDFSDLLSASERILVFWDAHGWDLADHVLAHLMPRIAAKPHLVLCHDISDARALGKHQLDYGGKRPWRGMGAFYEKPGEYGRVVLGWAFSCVDQVVPILDFCARNEISLHSADFEFQAQMKAESQKASSLFGKIPGLAPSDTFHYAWFTLNEAAGRCTFPAGDPFAPRAADETSKPLPAATEPPDAFRRQACE